MLNMMAFSTVCSKSWLERLVRCLWLLGLLPVFVWAAEIEISNTQLIAADDGYALSADFSFELNQRLEEAVSKGVALHFIADFEMTRPRWYWLDEKLVSRSQTFRLSYHALTRQYRVSTGGLHQSFVTLSEALRMLSHLRNWLVVERGDKSLKAGDSAQAALRLRLDLNQLPRPFQISALGNKDWTLGSDWKIWSLTLPPLPNVPAQEAR
jgi:hypothetical protein